MSKVFFISDTHLGCDRILKYRPEFSTIEEHDSTIIGNILKTVGKRDILWILGDVATNMIGAKMVVALSKHCRIKIVLGNHDTESKDSAEILKMYIDHGIELHSFVKYKGTWLSHCPIHPIEFRGCRLNIHGHLHSKTVGDERYFNVSCEQVDYTPIYFFDIPGVI